MQVKIKIDNLDDKTNSWNKASLIDNPNNFFVDEVKNISSHIRNFFSKIFQNAKIKKNQNVNKIDDLKNIDNYHEWIREIQRLGINYKNLSINEEVYVKRSNGSVEKWWFVEGLDSNGFYQLKNPKKNLRRYTLPNDIWSLKEIEEKGYEYLIRDNVALLEKIKLEILEKYTTLPKEQFDYMFGKWNTIKQQNVGNCYLIASLNSLRESPHFEVLVRTSIKVLKDGWEVKIPLSVPNGKSFFVTKKDLEPQLNTQYKQKNIEGKKDKRKYLYPVNASIGYKILEAAFIKMLLDGRLNRSEIEGGVGHQALLWLLGDNFKKVKINSSDKNFDNRFTLWQYLESPPFTIWTNLGKNNLINFFNNYDNAKFIATANTPLFKIKNRINWIKFINRHAYSIVNVDKFKQKVFLVNPWDTSKIIELSYDHFMLFFNQISAVEINPEELLKSFVKKK